jgi:hypothetical protein
VSGRLNKIATAIAAMAVLCIAAISITAHRPARTEALEIRMIEPIQVLPMLVVTDRVPFEQRLVLLCSLAPTHSACTYTSVRSDPVSTNQMMTSPIKPQTMITAAVPEEVRAWIIDLKAIGQAVVQDCFVFHYTEKTTASNRSGLSQEERFSLVPIDDAELGAFETPHIQYVTGAQEVCFMCQSVSLQTLLSLPHSPLPSFWSLPPSPSKVHFLLLREPFRSVFCSLRSAHAPDFAAKLRARVSFLSPCHHYTIPYPQH